MFQQRYVVVCRLMVTPAPQVVAYADTPEEAVRLAREATKQGKRDVRIGDQNAQQHYDAEAFASKHNIR